MTIDLTTICQAIISLIATVITVVLIPMVKNYLKQRLTEKQYERLQSIVRNGVHAAEQIYRETGMGQIKKDYVIKLLQAKGFDVDDVAVDAAIEAAVLEMKNGILDNG